MSEKGELIPAATEDAIAIGGSIYFDSSAFERAKKVTAMLQQSDLVPEFYKNSPASIMIALDQAQRLNISPIFLMQRMSVVKGKPVIEGQLVIALINQRGPFKEPLKFTYKGEGDKRECVCSGERRDNNSVCETAVSVAMAKAMGWYERNPIWKAMTDQMLAYRSAMLLSRVHCPEVVFGMQLRDEVLDVRGAEQNNKIMALNERLKKEREMS